MTTNTRQKPCLNFNMTTFLFKCKKNIYEFHYSNLNTNAWEYRLSNNTIISLWFMWLVQPPTLRPYPQYDSLFIYKSWCISTLWHIGSKMLFKICMECIFYFTVYVMQGPSGLRAYNIEFVKNNKKKIANWSPKFMFPNGSLCLDKEKFDIFA